MYFFLIYFQTQDTNTNIFVHYPYLESICRNLSRVEDNVSAEPLKYMCFHLNVKDKGQKMENTFYPHPIFFQFQDNLAVLVLRCIRKIVFWQCMN